MFGYTWIILGNNEKNGTINNSRWKYKNKKKGKHPPPPVRILSSFYSFVFLPTLTLCSILVMFMLSSSNNDLFLPSLSSTSFFVHTSVVLVCVEKQEQKTVLSVLTCVSVWLTTVYGLFFTWLFQAKTGFLWKGQCHLLLLRSHSVPHMCVCCCWSCPLSLPSVLGVASLALGCCISLPPSKLREVTKHTLHS